MLLNPISFVKDCFPLLVRRILQVVSVEAPPGENLLGNKSCKSCDILKSSSHVWVYLIKYYITYNIFISMNLLFTWFHLQNTVMLLFNMNIISVDTRWRQRKLSHHLIAFSRSRKLLTGDLLDCWTNQQKDTVKPVSLFQSDCCAVRWRWELPDRGTR